MNLGLRQRWKHYKQLEKNVDLARKHIPPEKAEFLKYELSNGDAKRQKVALQEMCKCYRSQLEFTAQSLNEIENSIAGILLREKQDLKVVRWSFNTLANLGRRDISNQQVKIALKHYQEYPEIQAAGIAALTYMFSGKIDEIEGFDDFDPKIRTLAALQNTPPNRLEIGNFRIDVDKDSDEVLRLALITVGLNKDIENLFHPKHSNGSLVKELGQHSDRFVVQYSIWAILENKKLEFSHVGIDLIDIEAHPPNVQSKALQLISEKSQDRDLLHKTVLDGPFYRHTDAREGLAKGLLNRYYEGIEGVTIDWFRQESSMAVKHLLAEHIARFGSQSILYEDEAVSIMQTDGRTFGKRLLVGAEKTRLWSQLVGIANLNTTGDLFSDHEIPLISLIKAQNTGEVEKQKVKKKVLFLAANPDGPSSLHLDREARDLQEKISRIKSPKVEVVVEFRWATKITDIQDALFDTKPNILHFSGHGSNGVLCFEDQQGKVAPVQGRDIANLVKLTDGNIDCVVLNACFSDEISALLSEHVQAVIGCVDSIDDEAAISFSRALYRAISHGETYEKAFNFAKLEVSMNEGEGQSQLYKLRKPL